MCVFCKKCGFENKPDVYKCEKCGENLFEKKIKCKKCGYLNDNNLTKCLNCSCTLNKNDVQNIVSNNKINNKLNCIIFSVFNIIFTFIVPLVCLIILYILDKKILFDNLTGVILGVVSLILLIISFLFSMFLSTLFTKLLLKNVSHLKKYCLIWLYIFLMLILFEYFNNNDVLDKLILNIMFISKLFDWFLSRKLLIKEKFAFSKKTLYIYSGTALVVLLIGIFIMPTTLNKKLFLKFGKTDFSSKETYMYLIDKYNKIGNKNVNYFHKLGDKELAIIDDIYIDDTFTNDDIKKLSNLSEISISKRADVSDDLNFSNFKNLTSINIFSENLKSLELPINSNLENLIVYSFLDELNISNKNISNYTISAKTLYVNNDFFDIDSSHLYQSKYVCFNKLIIEDKSLYLDNDEIMCMNMMYKNTTLHNIMNISNIKGDNLKIVLKDRTGKEIENDYLIDNTFYGDILIYDINDNLIFKSTLDVRM